ncbi:MAG: hypothetical protein ABIJ08_01055 [Nanoarchaeota archaeon]
MLKFGDPCYVNVVDLGNTYWGMGRTQIKEYMGRFRNGYDPDQMRFFGIDRRGQCCKNKDIVQLDCDFADGLERFGEGSISVLVSDMAFGHYAPYFFEAIDFARFKHRFGEEGFHKYQKRVLEIAREKIRPGGVVSFSAVESVVDSVIVPALDQTGFANIRAREFKPEEYDRTLSTEYALEQRIKVVQIGAVNP